MSRPARGVCERQRPVGVARGEARERDSPTPASLGPPPSPGAPASTPRRRTGEGSVSAAIATPGFVSRARATAAPCAAPPPAAVGSLPARRSRARRAWIAGPGAAPVASSRSCGSERSSLRSPSPRAAQATISGSASSRRPRSASSEPGRGARASAQAADLRVSASPSRVADARRGTRAGSVERYRASAAAARGPAVSRQNGPKRTLRLRSSEPAERGRRRRGRLRVGVRKGCYEARQQPTVTRDSGGEGGRTPNRRVRIAKQDGQVDRGFHVPKSPAGEGGPASHPRILRGGGAADDDRIVVTPVLDLHESCHEGDPVLARRLRRPSLAEAGARRRG